jgi:hypothetical protein
MLLNSTVACAFALSSTAALADAMDDLVAAAKAEGELTTIALPHDWCLGGVIDGFKANTAEVNEPGRWSAMKLRRSRPTRTTRVRRRLT